MRRVVERMLAPVRRVFFSKTADQRTFESHHLLDRVEELSNMYDSLAGRISKLEKMESDLRARNVITSEIDS